LFWWRKRNDGFEWRDYVRTTILVRREQRKQRLKDVRDAAAEQVRVAGKRGVEASLAGASYAGSSAWDYAKRFASGSASFLLAAASAAASAAGRLARGLVNGAGAVSRRVAEPLGPVLAPVLAFVREPKPNLVLMIVAVLTALGAAYRTWGFGFDGDARVAALVALISAVVLALAYLTDPYRSRRRGTSGWSDGLLARLRTGEVNLPGERTVSAGGAIAIGALALVAAAAAGSAAYYFDVPGQVAALMPAHTTQTRQAQERESEPDPGKLEGRALAVSGHSLRISGELVVLDGIEAPEATQICRRKSGQWRCGAAAKDALAGLVRGRQVACDVVDEEGTMKRARCYVRGTDVAQQLVHDGNVFAEGGFLSRYAGIESDAQTRKVGIWAGDGDAERPQDYRDKRWEEATKAAPEGCPIKGRIRSGARVYVLPWSPSYDSIKLSTTRGERWFCSESEAKAAGWMSAARS